MLKLHEKLDSSNDSISGIEKGKNFVNESDKTNILPGLKTIFNGNIQLYYMGTDFPLTITIYEKRKRFIRDNVGLDFFK